MQVFGPPVTQAFKSLAAVPQITWLTWSRFSTREGRPEARLSTPCLQPPCLPDEVLSFPRLVAHGHLASPDEVPSFPQLTAHGCSASPDEVSSFPRVTAHGRSVSPDPMEAFATGWSPSTCLEALLLVGLSRPEQGWGSPGGSSSLQVMAPGEAGLGS